MAQIMKSVGVSASWLRLAVDAKLPTKGVYLGVSN